MSQRLLLIALVSLLGLYPGSLAIAGDPLDCGPVALPDQVPKQLNYLITRSGETIGRHQFRFVHRDGTMQVQSRTKAAIGLAFITFYSFSHDSTEVWRSGQLIALTGRTDDDGDLDEVSFKRNASNCGRTDRPEDGQSVGSGSLASGSLWSEAMLAQDWIIDPVDGSRRPLQSTYMGSEKLRLDGGLLPTERYRVGERELWFGPAGLLVKMRVPVKDGSAVEMTRSASPQLDLAPRLAAAKARRDRP